MEKDRARLRLIVERQLARNRKDSRRLQERREDMLRDAERLAADMVRDVPGIRRIVLFGSLVRESAPRSTSDIDLAIEGGNLAVAMRVAEASRFPVDVCELDSLRPAVAQRVAEGGRVLYEARSS